MCVCVCVCVRASERERDRECASVQTSQHDVQTLAIMPVYSEMMLYRPGPSTGWSLSETSVFDKVKHKTTLSVGV